MLKKKLLRAALRFKNRFPSPLPVGAENFNQFADSILSTYEIPNLPSYHHAIASMIMHLGPQVTKAPKAYFAASIKKAMANETAFQKMQMIKEEAKKSEKPAEPVLEQPQNGA